MAGLRDALSAPTGTPCRSLPVAYTPGLVGASACGHSDIFKVFDRDVIMDFPIAVESCGTPVELNWIPLIAFQPFRCPDYIRQIATEKSWPYEVRGVSAFDAWEGLPFTRFDLHTYLTEKWTLGSQSRDYLDGHCAAACIAHWAKRFPVHGMQDFKVLFSRYQINDSATNFTKPIQPELGRMHSLQDGGTVLVFYKPKTSQVRKVRYKDTYERGMRSMRLDLQIPLYNGNEIDQLLIGNRAIDPRSPNVVTDWSSNAWIYLRDGDVFLGIHPLEPTNLGGERPLRMRRYDKFLSISISNLDVPDPREIPDDVLDRCKNGFVLQMGDTVHYPTLDDFRRHSGRVTEEATGEEGVRSVCYRYGDRSLEMKYNMVTEEFMERKVNGQPSAYPLFNCPDAYITDDPAKEGLRVGNASSLLSPTRMPGW